MIRREKRDELFARMQRLGVQEEDIIEKFILGSGRGGQKINKTSSQVYLKHLPSGIEIKCQESRSREMNRYQARKRLCERLEEISENIQSEKQKLIEKIRRQKRKRSKRSKEKMLKEKKAQSKKKTLRKSSLENFS